MHNAKNPAEIKRLENIKALESRIAEIETYLDMPGRIQLYRSYCPTREIKLSINDTLRTAIHIAITKELATARIALKQLTKG